MTSRRGVPDDSPSTIGGFLDSIIAIRQEGRSRQVDYFNDTARITRWLKLLPHDPVEAKDAAFALLADENSTKVEFTTERTESLFLFDRGVHEHLLKLETDYLATQVGGDLEDVLWRACSDLSRAMIVTYERAFNDNLERMGSRAALLTVTLILVRMIHYLAWQARLTAYRHAEWIPGRWQQLHRLYRKARAFNIQLHGVADLSDPAKLRKTSIESEYLSLLLMWRLASGTLSRTELAQAYYWLKDRPRTIVFATTPRPGTRLAIDPTQPEGLRPLAQLTGPGDRYLFDSTVLAEPLATTVGRIEERLKTSPREPELSRLRQQMELVRYLTAHWVVDGFTERAERIVVDRHVEGYVGIEPVMGRLKALAAVATSEGAATTAGAAGAAKGAGGAMPGTAAPAIAPPLVHGAAATASNTHRGSASASQPPLVTTGVKRTWVDTAHPHAGWTIRDQSTSGCRVLAPALKTHAIRVGDVIAMHDATGAWDVALVRRWKLAGDDRVEMGLLWLARNAHPLLLHPAAGRDRDPTPVHALGGEVQGGDRGILLALVPARVGINKELRWERAARDGKAVLAIDAVELATPDWCWMRMRVLSIEAGRPGAGNEFAGGGVDEIEITPPRD